MLHDDIYDGAERVNFGIQRLMQLAGRSALSIQAVKAIVDAVAAGGTDLDEVNEYWQHKMAASSGPRTGNEAFLGKRVTDFHVEQARMLK